MSNRLTELPAATTPLTGTEVMYLVQGGNSRMGTTSSFYIPGGTDVAVIDGGTGSSTASGARTNLGLVIGTDVQAYDADLTAWAGVNPSSYSTTAAIAAAYQPLDSDLTSWAGVTRASGFDTFAATPSSANLRALLSDEVGTGAAYFVGGALGTPASGVMTNMTGTPASIGLANGTGLSLTTGVTGTLPIANGGTNGTTAGAARLNLVAPTYVADRTALKALDTTKDTVALLKESGREGWFRFSSSNLSTLVSADTQQGIYVAPTSDTTGASGAWVRQRDSLDVYVKWFGAVGDGVTDDLSAINKAILALPVTGGSVIFDGLTYRTSGAIVIGDGTSSTFSTRYGVNLVGVNIPIDPPVWSAYPQGTGTKIKIDNVTGAIVDVRGPLRGWGVKNMVLQGNTLTNYGIKAMSAGFGRVENVSIYNCQSDCIHLNSYSTSAFAPTTQNVNTERVHFQNVFIQLGASSGCTGVRLAGNSDGTSSTCFCSFDTLDIVMGTTSVVQYGIYLAVADTNIFTNAHIYGSSNASSVAVVADFSFNSTFPSANYFFGIDPALQGGLSFATNGTPGAFAQQNRVYGCSNLNGSSVLSVGFAIDELVKRSVLDADFSGSNVSTAQPVFPTAQDEFTVRAGVAYKFKGLYIIARGAGSTSHTTGVLFGGTATITNIDALAEVSNGDAGALGTVVHKEITVATNTVVTAANTSTIESVKVKIDGIVRFSAAGTFIPQFQYSAAPGAAPAIRRGSFFEMTEIGPSAFTKDLGWA